jgi:ubiquinone/menaquinone biosynthesis C-methylase UbiE
MQQQNYFQLKHEYFEDAVNWKKFGYLMDYIKIHKPQRLLDVGSGRGIITLELHNLVPEIHGIEFSESNLQDAVRFRKETETDNVFFHKANGKRLPFRDNHFDLVICSQVLEHIENPQDVIREIARVAKDKVIIDVPTPLWETWQFSQWVWNRVKKPSRTLKRYREVRKEGTATIKRAFQPGHVNKWPPWKWHNIVKSNGIRIKNTYSCYMSPTKKFNMLSPIEDRFRTMRPFKYMGMAFFIEGEKRT